MKAVTVLSAVLVFVVLCASPAVAGRGWDPSHRGGYVDSGDEFESGVGEVAPGDPDAYPVDDYPGVAQDYPDVVRNYPVVAGDSLNTTGPMQFTTGNSPATTGPMQFTTGPLRSTTTDRPAGGFHHGRRSFGEHFKR